MMRRHPQSGFTLTELVIVLVLVAILSAYIGPRFFTYETYASRGFGDDLIAALRYAQKVAVASGCDITVTINDGAYSLTRLENCDTGDPTPIPNPGYGSAGADADYVGTAPNGVQVDNAAVTFYALGRADSNAAIGVGDRTINIVATTGLVSW